MSLTVEDLVKRVWNNCVAKGWTERPIPIPEQVALLHSEASEMLESWRSKEPVSWTDEAGKPQGIGSELADIIIRACHYAVLNSVDIEDELVKKMTYNESRPYRHGGKQG